MEEKLNRPRRMVYELNERERSILKEISEFLLNPTHEFGEFLPNDPNDQELAEQLFSEFEDYVTIVNGLVFKMTDDVYDQLITLKTPDNAYHTFVRASVTATEGKSLFDCDVLHISLKMEDLKMIAIESSFDQDVVEPSELELVRVSVVKDKFATFTFKPVEIKNAKIR
jgi:hypothetical protein